MCQLLIFWQWCISPGRRTQDARLLMPDRQLARWMSTVGWNRNPNFIFRPGLLGTRPSTTTHSSCFACYCFIVAILLVLLVPRLTGTFISYSKIVEVGWEMASWSEMLRWNPTGGVSGWIGLSWSKRKVHMWILEGRRMTRDRNCDLTLQEIFGFKGLRELYGKSLRYPLFLNLSNALICVTSNLRNLFKEEVKQFLMTLKIWYIPIWILLMAKTIEHPSGFPGGLWPPRSLYGVQSPLSDYIFLTWVVPLPLSGFRYPTNERIIVRYKWITTFKRFNCQWQWQQLLSCAC